MSETVRQILQGKTAELQAVDPGISVFEALTIMAEHEIGSVLVLGNGKLLGIFTERDYARKVALQGRTSRSSPPTSRRPSSNAPPDWACASSASR